MAIISGVLETMGRQYSFKTTRRTTYLDDVLGSIPIKDRSEVLRQAVTIGLIDMGLLNNEVIGFTVPPKVDIGNTNATQRVANSDTKVEQMVNDSNTKVEQESNISVAPKLEELEFTVIKEDAEDASERLENALDNFKF